MAKERRCTAATYRFNIKDGNEIQAQTMTINGKDTTGSPIMHATIGNFPNLSYTMPFKAALDNISQWYGNRLLFAHNNRFNDTTIKVAYIIDKREDYDTLKVGEPFYIVAIDIIGGKYTNREKTIFVKA